MNRLFGTGGAKKPEPKLDESISNGNASIESLDTKIAALQAELNVYAGKIARLESGKRPGARVDTPAINLLRQKAAQVLKRRRFYEGLRSNREADVWNLERMQNTIDSAQHAQASLKALEATSKTMRKEYGKFNIDKIERLQDEMADLMDVSNEIQETLARGYDVPEDVDELELDAELEALGQDVEYEAELGGAEGVPSFMQDEVPEFIDEPPQTDGKIKEAAG